MEHETRQDETSLDTENSNGASARMSVMEALRAQHQESLRDNTTDLDIPTMNGMLVARYHLMTSKEVEIISAKTMREFRDSRADVALFTNIDGLIKSCEELFYRNPDGETTPLAQFFGPDAPPVTYDERLAEFLELSATGAREVVMNVFANNEMAILDHGRRLQRWMVNARRSATDDMLEGIS